VALACIQRQSKETAFEEIESMSQTQNTIVLKSKGHYDEGTAGGAVTPGMAVRMAADGDWDQETLTSAQSVAAGFVIAQENEVGGTVADAYASGDVMHLYTPLPGDHVNVLVKSGETVAVGNTLAPEGSGSGLFLSSATSSRNLALTSMKVHDALATDLPATAANDDMGIVTGTPGTDSVRLQGVDFGGTSTDEKAAFEFILPPEYRPGAPVTVRLNAKMVTAVSDGTATVDVEAWKDNGTGGVGSDICATAAQSINSLTAANKDFTITPTGLVAGNKLVIRLSFGGSDTGNLAVMIPQINAVSVIYGIAGNLQALEASDGALAANTLIACRAL